LHGALGVDAAGRGCPLVPARKWLCEVPALGLLDLVAASASCAGVAHTGASALVIGDCVLEVGLPGVPGAGREGALAVPNLDQVPQQGAWLVGVGLVAVVAARHRDGVQLDAEVASAGQGQ
jgi:hypothetical protein